MGARSALKHKIFNPDLNHLQADHEKRTGIYLSKFKNIITHGRPFPFPGKDAGYQELRVEFHRSSQ